MPAVVRSLAALEEWLAADDEPRAFLVERIPRHLTEWHVTVRSGTRSTSHPGLTMADALAQAAQHVVSDPTIGEHSK